jgi:hypothetical protein
LTAALDRKKIPKNGEMDKKITKKDKLNNKLSFAALIASFEALGGSLNPMQVEFLRSQMKAAHFKRRGYT